ncbi:hypothetical protein BGX28_008578 [Mortierella sp. GBA30]|nr:hypothetical protein BGX28_008578 [Mortierella sp. GBA30]
MATNVIANQELVAMITRSLSLRDISACMKTSKAMHKAFNPHLWKHIIVRKPDDKQKLARLYHYRTRGPVAAALHKNREFIETINLEVFAADYLNALLNIPPPPNRTSHTISSSAPTASPSDSTISPAPAPTSATAPVDPPAQPDFPRLKSISLKIGQINDVYSSLTEPDHVVPSETVLTVLERAPNVTYIQLPAQIIAAPAHAERMAKVLESGLPHLQTLRFNGYALVSVPCILTILPACFPKSELTTLSLKVRLNYTRAVDSPLVTKTMKAWAKLPTLRSAITDMEFPDGKHDIPTTFVFPIIKSCLPHLKVLRVPGISDQYFVKLADLVRDHCPNVRELIMDRYYNTRDHHTLPKGFKSIIEACKDLKIFKGRSPGGDNHIVVEALLKRASKLEGFHYNGILPHDLATLISTAPALQTLVIEGSPYNVKRAMGSRWACRHLRKLHLTLEVKDTTIQEVFRQGLHKDPEFNPDVSKNEKPTQMDYGYMAMRKAFKNIGELTELEDLYLNQMDLCSIEPWDESGDENTEEEWCFEIYDHDPPGSREFGRFYKVWTMGIGLKFLEGLKKLKTLRLDYGFEFMGQAEVEFMHKNWPCLESITFHGDTNFLNRHVYQAEHWMWLQRQRPWLRARLVNDEGIVSIIANCEPGIAKVLTRVIRQDDVLDRVEAVATSRQEQKETTTTKQEIAEKLHNVLAIFLDEVSRRHFYRKLSKTAASLASLDTADQGRPQLHEFFRYHSIGINTETNSGAIYSNNTVRRSNPAPPIWKNFYETGYITSRVSDCCEDWSQYTGMRYLKVEKAQTVDPDTPRHNVNANANRLGGGWYT